MAKWQKSYATIDSSEQHALVLKAIQLQTVPTMTIKLNQHDKQQCISKLQDYFDKELDVELGQFDADFLLDFIAKELGAAFYNQGIYDAQALLQSKIDTLNDGFSELEKPIR
ncbi:hypothetical protein PSPO_b0997 [Pseudoalteromonas spongiae UST010723-006]|nr:hypothetical protein PSPO_b0997 [Pseudoalteromonas spongiae UST010723-006]